MTESTVQCKVCNIPKPMSEFEPRRTTCKSCRNLSRKTRNASRRPVKIEPTTGMKICTACSEEKPFCDFGIHRQGKDGRRSTCNKCRSIASAEYYSRNKEKYSLLTKAWYVRNREEHARKGRIWRENNKDKLRLAAARYAKSQQRKEYLADYNARNKDRITSRVREWYVENRDAIRAYGKHWYHENKEKRALRSAIWTQNNKHKVRAIVARRRAIKLKATPKWVDMSLVESVYEHATRLTDMTGIKHEVDHIVPLTSDLVCGLHWHANLQVLPISDNRSKGNRVWPDMP